MVWQSEANDLVRAVQSTWASALRRAILAGGGQGIGFDQIEVAELLHVNVRTIKRRWQWAQMKLQDSSREKCRSKTCG